MAKFKLKPGIDWVLVKGRRIRQGEIVSGDYAKIPGLVEVVAAPVVAPKNPVSVPAPVEVVPEVKKPLPLGLKALDEKPEAVIIPETAPELTTELVVALDEPIVEEAVEVVALEVAVESAPTGEAKAESEPAPEKKRKGRKAR